MKFPIAAADCPATLIMTRESGKAGETEVTSLLTLGELILTTEDRMRKAGKERN